MCICSFFALQDFDFDALEKSTEYDNGLSEGSTVIRYKHRLFLPREENNPEIRLKEYVNVDC